MLNIFSEDLVKFKVTVADPKDAITKVGELLLNNDDIDSIYIDAMIEAFQTHGSYIVIAPGIAMPHAKVNNGVHNTSLSMVTLEDPIEFGHDKNDPVSVVLAIASKNDEEHLKNIQKVVSFFQTENLVENLEKITDYKQLKDYMEGL